MNEAPIQIVRLSDTLPDDFEGLCSEARAEAYRFVESLREEWLAGHYAAGDDRFAVFAAFIDGELAGVGALTPDPYDPEPDLLRVRRLYPAFAPRGRSRAGARLRPDPAGARLGAAPVFAGKRRPCGTLLGSGGVPARHERHAPLASAGALTPVSERE
ncbi:hypothetical protein [Bosea sp. TND4EK4]|uniref:hypothetical protein n=1 Tax=Bosea sp. TND4EK4 TaxID=1907408 RepID=UPI000954C2F0|nr:hypothetical protein [Bosea sp. TND4EK4]SIQ94867.1 hypothetical protein SAMN05880592_10786 [Bosea sp. TND4EK4]